SEAEVDRYRELVRRRAKGEPVAYILGQAYFRNLTLEVGRDVLIPRPETEHLVDIALKVLKSREWRQPPAVLDLGTGSGAIAIALAVEYPDAVVTATETSSEAQRLAEENARTAGVAARVVFVQSDMFESLDPVETYDLIVSNPPYVADGEWDMLPTDVREFEPRSAL
ncbi:MAG: peptide chain release factor N(5)-glutamine methyltransferase, partial [Actinomycetota bacterium]